MRVARAHRSVVLTVGQCMVTITLALVPGSAFAQRGQTSGLSGVVRDATGQPLTGVVLTMSSPQLIGGPHTARSDDNGRYRFAMLVPGTYTLAADAPGFESLQRSAIELGAGLTLTLDIVLNVAAIDRTIEVRAVVPTVDVHTSASPQLVERPLLENLPVPLSRSVAEYINLAPGIVDHVALGGAALANPLSLDGTSATSPVQGTPDAEPAINWLETLQIVSAGASAEYGEFTTAQLNAVTRSGANRFSGLGEYWWTRRAWAKFNELLEWNDATGQMGGPIRRDRVWFFGGFERYENVSRVAAFRDAPRAADEPLSENREHELLGKLTTAPTASMRLEGYILDADGESLNGNAGPRVSAEALGRFENDQQLHNVRWTWAATDRTLVEARVGRYSTRSFQGPVSLDQRAGPPPHIDLATFYFSGNFANLVDARRTAGAVQAALTRYFTTASRGTHEVKAGFEHERARAYREEGWPGNARYLDRAGRPDIIQFWDGGRYRPSHQHTSVFVQDNWQLGSVTFAPGVRVGVYNSDVPNAASQTYSNQSIAPRLGAAWDVFPDHRTVVRAHYGHYYDPMSTRFYEYLDTSAEALTVVARVVGPDQFEEVTRIGGPTSVPLIDRDVKHSFAEEWLAGVEREVWPRVSLKAQYIRRNTRNTIGFVDLGTIWTPIEVIDPGSDGRVGTPDDGGPLTIYYNFQPDAARFVMTNPAGAWRHYDGVQFVAARRYADGWSLQASYAWGRTVGSFDNENGSNAANTDVSTNGNFANPNRSIHTTGRTVFDRRHDVRAFGTYQLPHWGGLRISGVYRYTSGIPWGRTVNSFDPRTQATVLMEPIGTRHLPATHAADLRVEKTFSLPARTIAGIYGDVFNVTNHVVAASVIQNSGPAFGTVTAYTQPRRFRVGMRVTF